MKKILFDKIIEGKIISVSRICNLISIRIKSKSEEFVSLHIQSFFRITNSTRVLVSSEDIYRPNSEHQEEFNWDVPGESIFDESINKYKKDLLQAKIQQVLVKITGDIDIFLDNGFIIQIIIDTTISSEKYRIFDEMKEFVFVTGD